MINILRLHFKETAMISGLFLPLVFFAGCKDDNDDKPTTKHDIQLTLTETNAGLPVEWDTVQYQNGAGNLYSVKRLQYYLSDFRFHIKNGDWQKTSTVIYRDGSASSSLAVTLSNILPGTYDSVAFTFGLNSTMNMTNALPATTENLNMAWPVPMGGGYHFMKFEGHFINDSADKSGYALHLGLDLSRREIVLAKSFELNSDHSLHLNMMTDEWFQNPNTIDLNVTSYSMGIDAVMRKIAENSSSVFELIDK